ncbi:MAG: PmeII family type II restriction endonuclease [bacterium]|nr:PmeII family type II restriction endonuclease [bacterium]
MKKLKLEDVFTYVESEIGIFHEKRNANLKTLKLTTILNRKNPYLFKAKNILTAHDLVKTLLDAHLSSQEETLFGDWLEGLAIFINGKVYNGSKSGIPGIDLEFTDKGIRYIVNIKSGPNWGNSSQIKKMKSDFGSAIKTLKTSNSRLNVIAVNGCCYGKSQEGMIEGLYYKFCGQKFWEFISNNKNLYLDIIKPLGYKAKEKNESFEKEYSKIINRFTLEFSKDFCKNNEINWEKIVEMNSSARKLVK